MKKFPFLVSPAMAAGLAFTLLLPGARVQAATTIYFTGNDVIETFTPPGPMTNFANLPVFTNPEGLAFDTSGNLFVAGGGDVSKITPGGTVSTYATLSSGTTGLAIDSIGNLYTVGGGNTIKKIPVGGGAVSIYATLPGNNNYGLAFDSAGFLYASDITTPTLFKIPPGGGSYTNFGTLSSGVKGLAFDHNGNLYAAQTFEDKISMITPDGTTSTFATGLSGPRYLTFAPGTANALRITAVERFGNDLRLSYTSLAGTNYAVQSRADLSSGAWATLPGTTNFGTGSTLQQTLTNAFTAPQQFYRVQQSP